MAVGTGVSRATAPGVVPLIYNVTSPGTPDTEFSQVLSANVKIFMIKTRGNATLRLAYVSGETATNYITVPANSVFERHGVNIPVLTLYMQCNKASEIIEIEEWT